MKEIILIASLLVSVVERVPTAVAKVGRAIDMAHALEKVAREHPTFSTTILHVVGAMSAEDELVSAEVLLGIADHESRFSSQATSRLENGVRRTGIPKWAYPNSSVSGKYFCGVTQADAGFSWARCMALRNPFVSYNTTVYELHLWIDACVKTIKASNVMRCALLGYAGGKAMAIGNIHPYPNIVFTMAALLEKYEKKMRAI